MKASMDLWSRLQMQYIEKFLLALSEDSQPILSALGL